jgi:outer membrane protein TolC
MMRNKNRVCFLTLLLTLGVFVASGQENIKLSYENFVSNVLGNNPMAKRANNEKRYGDLNNRAARGSYDPYVTGNYANKYLNQTNYYTTLNGEVKQPIFTSQYLKFGYEYGVGSFVNPEFTTATYGLPYLGLEVGVLQGLVIDKRRADVLKSREYINYFNAESNIQLNNLLFESSQRYFDWLFSAKQVALNNYFMGLARQRLIAMEALSNIGEKAPIDTVEAAIFFQSRLLDLQNALLDNQKSLNDISSYNWQNANTLPTTTLYEPIDSLDAYYTKAKAVLVEKLYQDSVSNPVILKYTSFQKVLEIENRLRKEMIKPMLNVNYNFLSYNPKDLTPAFSNNNYKWGVNLAFPLFLRNPTNEYKMAKVLSQNNNLELSNKSNELNFKINVLKQTVSILSAQLQNAERSVSYNRQLVDAEREKFLNGESSLFILNARENKWLETELKLAEYKLKFIKTVLNVIYLKGNLNYTL